MPLNESQIIIRETFRSEIPSYCNTKSPAGPRHNCNLDSKVYHQTKANCNIGKEPRKPYQQINMVFLDFASSSVKEKELCSTCHKALHHN